MWARIHEIVTVRRVIMTIALALAGYLILYALDITDQDDSRSQRPSQVVLVFPTERAAGALRQEPIGFQLADGWTGDLQVDGRFIPLDQMQRPVTGTNLPAQAGLSGLNRFSFSPGPGKEIEQLPAGTHSAVVTYWPLNGVRERDAKSYSWSFRVV